MRKLPDAAFEPSGTHSETGEIKLGVQVKKYIEHLDRHLKFIEAKRGNGKETLKVSAMPFDRSLIDKYETGVEQLAWPSAD